MRVNILREFSPGRVFTLALLAIFFVLFLCSPLLHVVEGAFVVDGKPSFENLIFLLSAPEQLHILLTSFNIALGATLLATLFAFPIVLLLSRYQFYGLSLFSALVIIPLLLPPFVGALGLRRAFGRFGIVNSLFYAEGSIPFDWFASRGLGVALVQALHLYPLIFLSISTSIRSLDLRLIEAARMSGASKVIIYSRIVIPLLMPAYFSGAILVFVASFTDLGTPLLFEYREVLPVQIYNSLSDASDNPIGYSMVTFMAVLNVALFMLARSVLLTKNIVGDPRGGKRLPPRSAKGVMIWGLAVSSGLVVVTSLLPHWAVLLESLSERWLMSTLPERFTFAHYREVLVHPMTGRSLWNSLWLSSASTILDIFLGFSVAYLIYRTRLPGRSLLDSVTLLPLAIPGIVFAFGYIGAFAGTLLDPRRNPFPLLIAAYAVRRLPYMVRAAANGLQQASPALDEAARSVGAGLWRRLFKITLPLTAPQVISGALLCFAFAILEVSDSLLLALEERYYPVTKALFALAGRPAGASLASALGIISILLVVTCMYLAARFSGKSLGELFRS